MKKWITIFAVIAIAGIVGTSSICASEEVVSPKHKRTLKFQESTQKVEVQKPLPSYSPIPSRQEEKVDTFIDNDGDGTNVLLNKRDKKAALFNFLEDKANSYVKWKDKQSRKTDAVQASMKKGNIPAEQKTDQPASRKEGSNKKPRSYSKEAEQK